MVDYEKQLDAFYDQLELNPLTHSAVALWHALLYMRNKRELADGFTIASSVLCAKAGLKERKFYDTRNELKQKGYIDFKSRGGNLSASYFLTVLSAHIADKSPLSANSAYKTVDKPVDKSGDKSVDKTGALVRKIEELKEGQPAPATFKDIMDVWEEVFRSKMKPNHIEMIGVYLDQDGMTEALIIEGIERVKMAADPNMRYLWTTLNNWAKAEVKTFSDLIQHEKERVDQRPPNVRPFPPKKQEETLSERVARLKREGRIGS